MNSTSAAPAAVLTTGDVGARGGRIVWTITAAIALAIAGLIVAAPLAKASAHPAVASLIYASFGYVCHQIPERSFHLAGYQFAVCARCMGLYAGFALATLTYPLVRSLRSTQAPRRIWLILSAVPLAVDFALGYFAIWPNTHWSRFATGALLGAVAVFYIVPGLIELSHAFRHRRARIDSQVPQTNGSR